MFARLLLLFILVPFVEVMILIKIGAHIGFLPTVGMVLAIGILGAWLAKREGLKAFTNIQAELAAGRMPGDAMIDALLVLVAAVLMITPGLLTDAVGLALLIPPLRRAARSYLKARFRARFTIVGFTPGSFRRSTDDFIDVEAHPREEP